MLKIEIKNSNQFNYDILMEILEKLISNINKKFIIKCYNNTIYIL